MDSVRDRVVKTICQIVNSSRSLEEAYAEYNNRIVSICVNNNSEGLPDAELEYLRFVDEVLANMIVSRYMIEHGYKLNSTSVYDTWEKVIK